MSRNSNKARGLVLDTHLQHDQMGAFMICHCCGLRFDPATRRWRADHIRRHAEGGEESAENLWPILESCDVGKDGKAVDDTREVAKGKRVRANHYGVREKRNGFRKPPPGYNPWTRRIEE